MSNKTKLSLPKKLKLFYAVKMFNDDECYLILSQNGKYSLTDVPEGFDVEWPKFNSLVEVCLYYNLDIESVRLNQIVLGKEEVWFAELTTGWRDESGNHPNVVFKHALDAIKYTIKVANNG